MNKSEQICEALRKRYPCGELPHGAPAKLAVEFGVSGQLVRNIAAKMSYTRTARTPRLPMYCTCGRRTFGRGTRLCNECSWVTLPCEECGEPVRRRASRLATMHGRTTNVGTYTGRIFCNRQCFGQWFGKNYGTGSDYQKARRAAQ